MPPTPRPTVSAVIPAFQAEAYVADAIRSVLAQTVPVAECLVVDDGSSDGTAEIVERFDAPVRLVRRPNGGVSAARNTGIAEATSDLVAFLDADDAWLPYKLERQLAELAAHPDAIAAYGGIVITDAALRPRIAVNAPPPAKAIEHVLLVRENVPSVAQTGLVDRAMLLQLGGFDLALSTCADADLICRLAAAGPLAAVIEPVTLYRMHDGQMHRDAAALEHEVGILLDRVFGSSGSPQPGVEGLERRSRAAVHRLLAKMYALDGHLAAAGAHAAGAFCLEPAATARDLARSGMRRARSRRA